MASLMEIIPPTTLSPPALREYQQVARMHIRDAIARGQQSVFFSLPTGVGKAVILGALAADFQTSGRVLVIAHLRELIGQLGGHMTTWCGPDTVGVVMGSQDQPDADVVVASIQTLTRGRLDRILANPRPISALFIDEFHHSTAASYRAIIEAVRQHSPGVAIIGCSATPFRADKQSTDLAELFPVCAFERSIDDMQAAGWLAPLTYKRVEVPLELCGLALKIAGGESDYERSALSLAARDPNVVRILVAATASVLGNRPTLVFSAGVQHAQDLAAAYTAVGLRVAAVDGSMSPIARAGILGAWRAGEIQVVCQDSILGEGYDNPGIAALVLAAPTASLVKYIQRLGRGTRLAPGKAGCLILEATPGKPDQRQITLWQVMPVPEDTRRKPGSRNPKLVMIDPTNDAHWRWLQVNPGIYVAPVDNQQSIWLVRDPAPLGSGLYRAGVVADSRTLHDAIQPIAGGNLATAGPLRQMQSVAGRFLQSNANIKIAGVDERWLNRPASEKQCELLWRWGEDTTDLTRGQASELISLHIARRRASAIRDYLWPQAERLVANG